MPRRWRARASRTASALGLRGAGLRAMVPFSHASSLSIAHDIRSGRALVELGMVGLGRMGSNMVRRLMRAGVRCVVHDRAREAVTSLVREGAIDAGSPAGFVAGLKAPRHVWLMLPAAVVDAALDE